MTFQMSAEQANAYALRMYDDGDWDKEYKPNYGAIQLLNDEHIGSHLAVPVTLNVARHNVSEENADEYEDRPDAVESDLAEDDQGVITIECILAIPHPVPVHFHDEVDGHTLENKTGIIVKDFSNGSMYNGQVQLSDKATDHLITRINESYIVIDTVDQNKGFLKSVLAHAPT